jgi:hypothetical protein
VARSLWKDLSCYRSSVAHPAATRQDHKVICRQSTLRGDRPRPSVDLETTVRPAQPQRRREQPQLIHTPTTPCYATITDSHAANETTTPSSTRHAGTTPT